MRAPSVPGRRMPAAAQTRLLWPGLMTAAMLATTASLGAWQVQRLHWKTALLEEIDRGEAVSPIRLPADPQPFTKVVVTGRLRQDLRALYGIEVRSTRTGPAMGAYLLNPLERDGADPIIVNRGWVPLDDPQPANTVEATVEGYVRAPEKPVRFGAADDPSIRRFYALDPGPIGASLGLPRVAPFTLVTLGIPVPGNYPEPATAMPRPSNNHLSYAITWFGLAASLLVIFAIYARRVLRTRGPRA